MSDSRHKSIVEALILGTPEPISAQRIASVIPRCNPSEVRRIVEALNAEYLREGRAFEIWEVAGGYQMRSLAEYAPYLRQVQPERPLRLSRASLETLAIVAYRQPATRAQVEQIRGVDSGAVLRGLIERKLVRIAGHREVPGRPMLYATTRRFLEVFGIDRLDDLPTLRDLEELAPALGVEDEDGDAVAAQPAESGEVPDPAAALAFETAEPAGKPH